MQMLKEPGSCPFCNTSKNQLKLYSHAIDEFIHLDCLKEYLDIQRYHLLKLPLPAKLTAVAEELIAHLDIQEKEVLKWYKEDLKRLEIL